MESDSIAIYTQDSINEYQRCADVGRYSECGTQIKGSLQHLSLSPSFGLKASYQLLQMSRRKHDECTLGREFYRSVGAEEDKGGKKR